MWHSRKTARYESAPMGITKSLSFIPLRIFSIYSVLGTTTSALPSATDLNDCSKSAMMSSMCSVPTEMRMRSSVAPDEAFSSSESCSCVVDQGL